jgi:putative ubiquitin-RnfH superfamily antitoxin RatB of RatAB toxin-antitoxin module
VELSVARRVAVEVAYACAPEPLVLALEVEEGATLREAIERSGVLAHCPEIDLAVNGVGVFGLPRGLHEAVAAGDRVEIYRPLPEDPKALRRRRAARR